MAKMIIDSRELSALSGLPYLQRSLYLCGIRPYMDSKTCMVGIKRGISYQSLAEELYVEPHSGIKSGAPSKNQIRRALASLEQAGLLKNKSTERKLVFYCPFVIGDNFAQNKVGTKPTHDLDTKKAQLNSYNSTTSSDNEPQTDTAITSEAGTPLYNNNYIIFLEKSFAIFWNIYPVKKSRDQAWKQFQSLRPTEDLVNQILTALKTQSVFYQQQQAMGNWMPSWKNPANWLSQKCWQDEIHNYAEDRNSGKEKINASSKRNNARDANLDAFWESCKEGADYQPEFAEAEYIRASSEESAEPFATGNNIINFHKYAKN